MAPKKKSKKSSKTLAKAAMKKAKGGAGIIAIAPVNNSNMTSQNNFNTTSLNNSNLGGNNLRQP